MAKRNGGMGDTVNSPQLAGINKMQGPSQKITEDDAAEPQRSGKGKGQRPEQLTERADDKL